MAQDYTYMVARLRALEADLPDKAWFQRLARSPEESLLGSMREYFPGFEAAHSLVEFEKGIEAEEARTEQLILGLITDRKVCEFICAGYDFDNLVHAWKSFRLGKEPVLKEKGIVPAGDIYKAVKDESSAGLPGHLGALLERLQSRGGNAGDLAGAEYQGENAKYAYLLEVAPSPRARDYTRWRIDLQNIKTFIRLKRTALREKITDEIWIEGGEIERSRWREIFKEGEDELYAFLETTSYRALPVRGLERDTPLWKTGPVLRCQLFEMLGESRYRFFDLLPLIYHLEWRKRNSQLLRAVLAGKVNRLLDEIILESVEAILP
ncbi:MAG: V-type ATPase subunit [Candidatus Krumholzibacteriota bacterium]|nr:V-type ATPase subunit [Candidatus Krumholzibacteriota bacterium]